MASEVADVHLSRATASVVEEMHARRWVGALLKLDVLLHVRGALPPHFNGHGEGASLAEARVVGRGLAFTCSDPLCGDNIAARWDRSTE